MKKRYSSKKITFDPKGSLEYNIMVEILDDEEFGSTAESHDSGLGGINTQHNCTNDLNRDCKVEM
jgi:hypothetical protein